MCIDPSAAPESGAQLHTVSVRLTQEEVDACLSRLMGFTRPPDECLPLIVALGSVKYHDRTRPVPAPPIPPDALRRMVRLVSGMGKGAAEALAEMDENGEGAVHLYVPDEEREPLRPAPVSELQDVPIPVRSVEDDGDDQIEEFLSRLPAGAIQKEDEPRRTAVQAETGKWAIDPPLPETWGQVTQSETPPEKPENLTQEPNNPAPEKQTMLSLSVEKASAVAKLLSQGAPSAAKACEVPVSYAKAVQSWLCAWFDCGSNSLGRGITSADMVEAINKISEGGFIQIPFSEEQNKTTDVRPRWRVRHLLAAVRELGTQKAVADATGISQPRISNYCRQMPDTDLSNEVLQNWLSTQEWLKAGSTSAGDTPVAPAIVYTGVTRAMLPDRLRHIILSRKAEGAIEAEFLDAYIQSGMSAEKWVNSLRQVGGMVALR